MLPWLSTQMRGLVAKPAGFDRGLGGENGPPFVERLNRMIWGYGVTRLSSSHTTLMLPAASTATCGVKAKSTLFEIFVGAVNTICAWAPAHIDSKPNMATATSCPKRLG